MTSTVLSYGLNLFWDTAIFLIGQKSGTYHETLIILVMKTRTEVTLSSMHPPQITIAYLRVTLENGLTEGMI